MTTSVHVAGLTASVVIHRDPQGIPHVRAGSSGDAFFGQGWAHAEDRLFQMEYDRRRAYGRWAEWVGPVGVDADRLARRFRIEDSVRLDWERASSDARAMLTAFAAGVNAFIASTTRWGAEFEIAGARPEPWREWDSMAVFKIRHLDMGPWTAKLWRARLLRHVGPERAAELTRAPQPHPLLIVPPGAEYRGLRAPTATPRWTATRRRCPSCPGRPRAATTGRWREAAPPPASRWSPAIRIARSTSPTCTTRTTSPAPTGTPSA